MSGAWTIGIDPGQEGAIVALSSLGSIICWDTPLHGEPPTLWGTQLRSYIKSIGHLNIRLAVVENPGGARPKQGLSSTYRFGEMVGEIRGILIGLGVPVSSVLSTVWKPSMGVTRDKASSVAKVRALYPKYHELFEGPRGGFKDGRAEAVLLAAYAQRMVLP
jgi:hypothetical protein